MSRPLAGLLVLDLSRVLAGPYCTMTLGDLGARVLKIEEPGAGDPTRAWGPPFAGGESAYYLSVNRNKESLTLDFKTVEGAAILRRLIEKADILVENFRPGVLDRLGFGYEACSALNPRLVYASITGYGRTGPEADRPGYDLIAQGEGGVMSLTGDPAGPPWKTGVSQADITAGLWTLSGILAALHERETTGRGGHVEMALIDGQVSLLGYQALNHSLGHAPARRGNRHPNLTPYETFATRDGWLNVAVASEIQWQSFVQAIGRNELLRDARFQSNAARVDHREALETILVPILAARATADWLELFRAADVPAGAVRSVAEVLSSETIASRNMILTVDHPTAGTLRLTGLPVRLSEMTAAPASPPPRLGEHTKDVLKEMLNMTEEDIGRLRALGAV